jgi:hypothetical protein
VNISAGQEQMPLAISHRGHGRIVFDYEPTLGNYVSIFLFQSDLSATSYLVCRFLLRISLNDGNILLVSILTLACDLDKDGLLENGCQQ